MGINDAITTRPIPLRNITPSIVEGTDAATLQAALTAFFESGGDNANIVGMIRVADYKVLILYTQ